VRAENVAVGGGGQSGASRDDGRACTLGVQQATDLTELRAHPPQLELVGGRLKLGRTIVGDEQTGE
jgi:hypothetical protein